MAFKLIRATPDNRLFDRLKAAWDVQLNHDDAPSGLYIPMMEHAERICAEHPQDHRYGIFVSVNEGTDGFIEYEGLIHINHKFPGTSASTLRLVWNLIAPRYAYDDVDAERIASILSSFFIGSLELATDKMPSKELKMYLGNAVDRMFATELISEMGTRLPAFKFAIRAGWLHINLI